MNFSVWSEFTPDTGDAAADFGKGERKKTGSIKRASG
jgi:hypothetical protein